MHESELEPFLEKRGGKKTYDVALSAGLSLQIIGAAYPCLVELYGPREGPQMLRSFFRMTRGPCTGRTVDVLPIPNNPKQSDFKGYEAEHPIDRQIMRRFAQDTSSGVLSSGQLSRIPRLDPQLFWKNQLHNANSQLGRELPIGGRSGPQPNNVNDRIMESLGSNKYTDPFMAVEKAINGAKGRIMQLQSPTDLDRIDTLARQAARQDSDEAVNTLLQAIRVVSHTSRLFMSIRKAKIVLI